MLKEYILYDKKWRDRLGIAENWYQHGNGKVNIFKDVIIILGLGGLSTGVIDLSNTTFNLFIVLAILWVWGCYTVGYLSEKFGWWKNQQKHLVGQIDIVHKKMAKDITLIKNNLKHITKK